MRQATTAQRRRRGRPARRHSRDRDSPRDRRGSGDRREGRQRSAERAGAARGRQSGHESERRRRRRRRRRRGLGKRKKFVSGERNSFSIRTEEKNRSLSPSRQVSSLLRLSFSQCMFSSSSASFSASDTSKPTDASVLRSARKRCHAARDAYASCVDASGTPPSARGTAQGLVVPRGCAQLREAFEKACKKSWVSFVAVETREREGKKTKTNAMPSSLSTSSLPSSLFSPSSLSSAHLLTHPDEQRNRSTTSTSCE